MEEKKFMPLEEIAEDKSVKFGDVILVRHLKRGCGEKRDSVSRIEPLFYGGCSIKGINVFNYYDEGTSSYLFYEYEHNINDESGIAEKGLFIPLEEGEYSPIK